ncbi:hypothetical protein GPALN_007497 [Globodera pallida]|nr:hypothetical protein GPALN_007497 [Globodera pallida]
MEDDTELANFGCVKLMLALFSDLILSQSAWIGFIGNRELADIARFCPRCLRSAQCLQNCSMPASCCLCLWSTPTKLAFAWFSDLLADHSEMFWSLYSVDLDAALELQPPDSWDSFENFKMGIFHTKLINQFSPMVVRYIDLMEHSISQSLEKNFFREKWEMRKDVFWKLDALQAFIQDLNWPEEEFAKYLQVRMRTLAAEIISNSADGSNIVELWPDGISYKLASLQMPAHMRDFDKITIRRVDNEVAAFFQQLRTTFSGLGVVINTHSNKHSSWQQSDCLLRNRRFSIGFTTLGDGDGYEVTEFTEVAGPIGKLEHTAVSLSISEDSEELQAIKVLQQKVTARFDQLSNNMKRMYSNLRHRNLM